MNNWSLVYTLFPPILRLLERLKFHNYRQPFIVGRIDPKKRRLFETHLRNAGFEPAILAWVDPGEISSMRKIDNNTHQYHIRLFEDGEIRAHYEYSPEGAPIKHCAESLFEPKREYFLKLLHTLI